MRKTKKNGPLTDENETTLRFTNNMFHKNETFFLKYNIQVLQHK